MADARALTDLGGKPLYALTASDGNKAGWTEAQDHLAGLVDGQRSPRRAGVNAHLAHRRA